MTSCSCQFSGYRSFSFGAIEDGLTYHICLKSHRNSWQDEIKDGIKTHAQATASVAKGFAVAAASTAVNAIKGSISLGASAAGTLAPSGLIGQGVGAVVGSFFGAAAGLLISLPSAYTSVRSGFGSAASVYAEHDAE
jgi:hypothetical protein